jgi:hypothetical protein
MDYPRKRTEGCQALGDPRSGLGVPCPQAQADGVPCMELIDCAECYWGRMTGRSAVPSVAAPDSRFEAAHA